jgi:Flp pilus assembly pilin Flp
VTVAGERRWMRLAARQESRVAGMSGKPERVRKGGYGMLAYTRMVRDYINSLAPGGELLSGSDEGQGMIEYALIIGVIVLALVVAYTQTGLGSAIAGIFEETKTQLEAS